MGTGTGGTITAVCAFSLMDRTPPSEGGDAGSIPARHICSKVGNLVADAAG